MSAFFQQNGNPGKHMDRTVLLHIAAILYYDTAPVAAESGAWADVHIFTNYYVARYSSLWMNERRRVNDWNEAFK
jgi:hypothetical protein